MLAFEEAVVCNQNLEVVVVIVAQSLRAGEISAYFFMRHSKVGRVIEKKQASIGRVGEPRKVIRFQSAEAFQGEAVILRGLLNRDTQLGALRGKPCTYKKFPFMMDVLFFQNAPSSLRSTRISRSFAPSLGPTTPRLSNISITRAARV